MESLKLRPQAQIRTVPDPACPGSVIRADWYQQITGLPLPEDQLPIEELMRRVVSGIAVELNPYSYGYVAVQVVADWLHEQGEATGDAEQVRVARNLRNAALCCAPQQIDVAAEDKARRQ
jgi:hypothetical protein